MRSKGKFLKGLQLQPRKTIANGVSVSVIMHTIPVLTNTCYIKYFVRCKSHHSKLKLVEYN